MSINTISYNQLAVDKAIDWMNATRMAIIYPTDSLEELEELWILYNSMLSKYRDISDDQSIILFGVKNQDHYEYLKSRFIKDDIRRTEIESDVLYEVSSAEDVNSLAARLDSPEKISEFMKRNIKYKSTEKLQDPEETLTNGYGDCHDQSWLEYQLLNSQGDKYSPKMLFAIEYYDESKPGGRTHTLVYYKLDNKYYWIENAWNGKSGINGPYDSIDELKNDIVKSWPWSERNDKLTIGAPGNIKPGMSLEEYVSACIPENVYYKNNNNLDESFLSRRKDNKLNFFRKHLNLLLESNESAVCIAATIKLMRENCKGVYEDSLFSNVVSDVCDAYDQGCISASPELYVSDLPALTPEEIEDSEAFSSDPEGITDYENIVSEESRHKWFEEYKSYWESCNDIPSCPERVGWIRQLMTEMSKLNESQSTKKRKLRKMILELGWNPDVEFTPENRNRVDRFMKTLSRDTMTKVDVVDLRDVSTESYTISESRYDKSVHPVFIIVAYKKGSAKLDFIGYSFDPSMNDVYIAKIAGFGNGRISKESLKNYGNHQVAIAMTFIGDKGYRKMNEALEEMQIGFSSSLSKKFKALLHRIDTTKAYSVGILKVFTHSLLSIFGLKIDENLEVVDPGYGNKNTKKAFIIYDYDCKYYNVKRTNEIMQACMNKNSKLAICENSKVTDELDTVLESFICQQRDAISDRVYHTFLSPIAEAFGISDILVTNEGFEITNDLYSFDQIVSEAGIKGKEKFPFFVVLFQGKKPWSPIISKITGSQFSHAAISFDPKLDTMYSFAVNVDKNGVKQNGFIKESISYYKKNDIIIGIYCMLLDNIAINKMKEFVSNIEDQMENTKYYLMGLVRYLFSIPKESDLRMICSQFCDKVLRSAGIDVTGKKTSALVSPADFEKSAKKPGAKIFELFVGPARKFTKRIITSAISKLPVEK